MLDFIGLSEILSRAQAMVTASEVHGFLCGQLCISANPDDEIWREFLDVQTRNEDLVIECHEYINDLITEISGYMHSSDLDFQLLLPDPDSPLEHRVEALADWCHGFLNGFGTSIEISNLTFSEDCREILEDYSRICRAGLDDETSDEDEWALADLVEYVRMSAIVIFSEAYFNYPVNYLKVLH